MLRSVVPLFWGSIGYHEQSTHGCTQVMVERFDPLVVLASIHKERCTALYGVPTMFIAELHHPMFDLFDMSCLRTGIMAGSLVSCRTDEAGRREDVYEGD